MKLFYNICATCGNVRYWYFILCMENKNLTVGSIVALIALIENAYTPIAIFNVLYVQYKLDKASYKRFEEFLDLKEDNQLRNGDAIHTDIGEISIKTYRFNMKNGKLLMI